MKQFFFLLILGLGSLSYGDSLEANFTCKEILNSIERPAFVTFNTEVKRPKRGNTINPQGLKEWINAHLQFGQEYFELANFIGENIEVLTQETFENLLKESMQSFFRSIDQDQKYFIIINEDASKGQLWVAQLINDLVIDRPPVNVLLEPSREVLSDYIAANPEQVPLIVDDASYMGQGITDGLNTIFETVRNSSGKQTMLSGGIQVDVHVVVAAAASEALSDFKRYIGLVPHYSHHMKSFAELLEKVQDLIKKQRLADAFNNQYDIFSNDSVLTGFAHKTADHASVVGLSSDETYEEAWPTSSGEKFNPRLDDYGATVLEGILLGPDNLYRTTIPILNFEIKPYGTGR